MFGAKAKAAFVFVGVSGLIACNVAPADAPEEDAESLSSAYYLDGEGEPIPTLPNGCPETRPNKTPSGTCVITCPSSHPYADNNYCSQQCPSIRPWLALPERECWSECRERAYAGPNRVGARIRCARDQGAKLCYDSSNSSYPSCDPGYGFGYTSSWNPCYYPTPVWRKNSWGYWGCYAY